MNALKKFYYRLLGYPECPKCTGVGTVEAHNPVYGAQRFKCDRCGGAGFYKEAA